MKFKFNKAPTLKQNQKEISNLIKRKKQKRMKELKSIYNNILINESKSLRTNLYVTGSGIFSKKNSTTNRNRSNDGSIIKQNIEYKSNNEINNSSEYNASLFNKNNFKFHSSKNISDNGRKTINKSLIFQEINKSQKYNSQNVLPMLCDVNRKIINSSNKSLSKMRMLVNDVIFNDLKSVKEFSEKEDKMIKFRIAQNIQCKEIKNIEKRDEYFISNKLNKLKEIKNIFENNYAIYSYDINNYIN